MVAGKLLRYALSGEGFRQAAALFGHCIGKSYDVVFAAGSQVDLQWVIPAYVAARARGIVCALAGPELKMPAGMEYINLPIRLFPLLRTRIIVTATTGLKAAHMPRQAVHRVAVPHSLVSLHMVYPEGTFDPYTDIFCCGSHHLAEIEAMNRLAGRADRRPTLIGYGKAERLLETRPKTTASMDGRLHILIGPSWGKGNILEAIGDPLLARLLAQGYRVTLRPHPSFFILGNAQLAPLVEKWREHEAFALENSLEESRALWTADLLIADYSGFAMEFAFMRERPVLYIDVPSKVLNPKWGDVGSTPIELYIRDRIGIVVPPDVELVMDGLRKISQHDTEWSGRIHHERETAWVNLGHFGEACAAELSNMLAKTA
ncbi:hypothetical protein [Pararhizobium sp.]|uniref:hypothetical protein n=1 Tax=Pararhizobium sp. TaxID=1977563 RepID=UPI0027237718|nr:hypothetical protein [Pararhizobium sp.]MDO9418348.1 hypothetical protein [Pararhizobium sp.]